MNRFVTIASFRDLPLAELAKTKLESEGITSFLENKNHISINWLYSFALGGVQVKVRQDDAEKASQILNADFTSELDEIEDTLPPIDQNDLCRKCGSRNLELLQAARKAGALTLLTGLPLFIFRKRYKCRDCGHIMKTKPT
ncbi:MAG: DUF2007 domain-containing protein [Desulfobacterales bacterium]|nr:DUF2007 domain-containing protein [Desulfobacterales bacterium]